MKNVYGLMFLEGFFASPSAIREAAEAEARLRAAEEAAALGQGAETKTPPEGGVAKQAPWKPALS